MCVFNEQLIIKKKLIPVSPIDTKAAVEKHACWKCIISVYIYRYLDVLQSFLLIIKQTRKQDSKYYSHSLSLSIPLSIIYCTCVWLTFYRHILVNIHWLYSKCIQIYLCTRCCFNCPLYMTLSNMEDNGILIISGLIISPSTEQTNDYIPCGQHIINFNQHAVSGFIAGRYR